MNTTFLDWYKIQQNFNWNSVDTDLVVLTYSLENSQKVLLNSKLLFSLYVQNLEKELLSTPFDVNFSNWAVLSHSVSWFWTWAAFLLSRIYFEIHYLRIRLTYRLQCMYMLFLPLVGKQKNVRRWWQIEQGEQSEWLI